MYKISEFSKLTGLSKETLRYYADVKLLEPAYVDPHNHYRYYDDGSFFIALLLSKLRALGFSIQEMREVMEDESLAHLEDLLKQKRQNIVVKMSELQEQLEAIDRFIVSGKEDEGDSVE